MTNAYRTSFAPFWNRASIKGILKSRDIRQDLLDIYQQLPGTDEELGTHSGYSNVKINMNSFDEIEKQYQELQDNPSASVVDLRHLLLDIEELVSSPDYQNLALDQRNTLQAERKELMRRIQEQENGNCSIG